MKFKDVLKKIFSIRFDQKKITYKYKLRLVPKLYAQFEFQNEQQSIMQLSECIDFNETIDSIDSDSTALLIQIKNTIIRHWHIKYKIFIEVHLKTNQLNKLSTIAL